MADGTEALKVWQAEANPRGLPPDAVEAASDVIAVAIDTAHGNGVQIADALICDDAATAALLAAQPAWEAWLREKVAQELEAAWMKSEIHSGLDAARICREGGTP